MTDIYFNASGKEQDNSTNAYVRKTEDSFYIVEHKGSLYHKRDLLRQTDKNKIKWRKVGPICFKNYMEYLTLNIEYRYLIANRNYKD